MAGKRQSLYNAPCGCRECRPGTLNRTFVNRHVATKSGPSRGPRLRCYAAGITYSVGSAHARWRPTWSVGIFGTHTVGQPGNGERQPRGGAHDYLDRRLVRISPAEAHQLEDPGEGEVEERVGQGPVPTSRAIPGKS